MAGDIAQIVDLQTHLFHHLAVRGGLRLVYTVDVDEAIKDKRDHYYEDMRLEATKVYGLHTGDELPSDETFAKLRDKVEIELTADERVKFDASTAAVRELVDKLP